MKKYILRRIISKDDCPGTCCKLTGAFPGSGTTRCVHFIDEMVGRKCGGCPFFKPDGSVDTDKLVQLGVNQDRFQNACNGWPVPDTVPAFDTEYPTHFGQGFSPICECFEWEMVDDGN